MWKVFTFSTTWLTFAIHYFTFKTTSFAQGLKKCVYYIKGFTINSLHNCAKDHFLSVAVTKVSVSQRFPTLLDINLHLLRNMIITLNHLSSVCYVLLISKDCSSCSMCRRRQCLLVNSRNLPTVKGTCWCWNLWGFVELVHKCWEEDTISLKRGRLIWNFLSACQEVIEPNFSLLCRLDWV